MAWLTTEKEWTTEKGQGSNNLASHTVPILDRASAPAAESGEAGAGGAGGGMAGMMGQMRGPGGSGGMGGAMGGGRSEGGMSMMRSMMGNMGQMNGQVGGAQADLKKLEKTLTRTDFLIQFVWQPKTEAERPKTDEERATKLKEIVAALTEAEKNNPAVKVSKEDMEKELDAVSRQKSEQIEAQIGAIGAGGGQPGAAPGGPAPAANAPGAAAPAPVAK